MPENAFQASRRSRTHASPQGVPASNRVRANTFRFGEDWRNACDKAPDSLLPGVASGFSNGDRRSWNYQ